MLNRIKQLGLYGLMSVGLIAGGSVHPVWGVLETIRPAGHLDAAAQTTSPTNAYDASGSSTNSTTDYTFNDSLNIRFGTTDGTVDDWEAQSLTWTDATIYVDYERTTATDDSGEILITNSAGTTVYTVLSSGFSLETARDMVFKVIGERPEIKKMIDGNK